MHKITESAIEKFTIELLEIKIGKGDRFIFPAFLLTAANVIKINLSPFFLCLIIRIDIPKFQ